MRGGAALLLAALLAAPAALAALPVTVDHAWSRATAGAAMPGAIFATIHGGAAADALLGVTTPIAVKGVLHRMDMDGGMMRMRAVPSMQVPADGTLTLGPNGDHVMLMGLKRGLDRGTRFPATFRFRDAPPVTVTVLVAGPGASAPP